MSDDLVKRLREDQPVTQDMASTMQCALQDEAAQTGDSIEVLINGEFIGLVYKDEDEGETSYDFNMAILAIDLPE